MIFYFTKQHFLIIYKNGKKYAYFIGTDLRFYKVDYKHMEKVGYKVNWDFALETFRIRYKDLDEYLEKNKDFVNKFREKWKRKLLVLGFTGGKDSVVLALTLEKLGLKYIPVYSHIPYLAELLYFFTRDIYEKFDAKIIEVPKETVKDVLQKGPPYVKCPLRSLKMKAIRKFMKENRIPRKNLVTGERIYESPQRYEKLKDTEHNPIQFLTDPEVFLFALQNDALSKIYYINTRASCIPCPRASTVLWALGYENLMLFEPEGFELLDKALEKDYHKKEKYLEDVSKEQFKWLGLHRIRPIEIKKEIERIENLMEYAKEVKKKEIYSSLKEFIYNLKTFAKKSKPFSTL